jgi:hypothetical protein
MQQCNGGGGIFKLWRCGCPAPFVDKGRLCRAQWGRTAVAGAALLEEAHGVEQREKAVTVVEHAVHVKHLPAAVGSGRGVRARHIALSDRGHPTIDDVGDFVGNVLAQLRRKIT